MLPSYEYLSLITSRFLGPLPAPRYKPEGLKGLTTSHPTYREDLTKAVDRLNTYFKDATKESIPLNCLILGPPGAGKTFLAKQLAKGIKKPVPFIELNVSLSSDPKAILEELAKHAGESKMVFIDEFDVTIGGSSVVRFLLDTMTSTKHHQTAFVFSGSYLKNKLILEQLNSNLSDFDFPLFLFHLLAKTQDEENRRRILQLYQACGLYQENRRTLSPDADLIQYLRQLHKLRDFLSRINGFIVQIPDLASPMMISDHALKLTTPSESNQSGEVIRLLAPRTAEDVKLFVEHAEGAVGHRLSWSFDDEDEAILQFKNMLLTERLGLVRHSLDELMKKNGGGKKTFFIRRQDLNYLVMVPLQHNVRSLRFLVEQCLKSEKIKDKDRAQQLGPFDDYCKDPHRLDLNTESPIAALHIAKEPFFDNAATLWAFVKAANSAGRNSASEDLICLSEIPDVLTVLLFGAEHVKAKRSIKNFQDLITSNGEPLFSTIQLIPVVGKGKLHHSNLEASQSTNYKIEHDHNVPVKRTEYLSLLSRVWGSYTLLVDAGDKLDGCFVQEALKKMKDDDPPSFVMTKSERSMDSMELVRQDLKNLVESDLYANPRPMLCRTRDLKELMTLDTGLTWPFDGTSHFLQDRKTVQAKCNVLEQPLSDGA